MTFLLEPPPIPALASRDFRLPLDLRPLSMVDLRADLMGDAFLFKSGALPGLFIDVSAELVSSGKIPF